MAKMPTMTPEMQNAAREQQIINARLAALAAVAQIHQGTGASMERVTHDTNIMVDFIIGDVQALKPRSALVLSASMPPEGMFKPGE